MGEIVCQHQTHAKPMVDGSKKLGDRTGSDGRHSVENTAQMGCDLRSNHHVEFGTDNKFLEADNGTAALVP